MEDMDSMPITESLDSSKNTVQFSHYKVILMKFRVVYSSNASSC